MGSFAFGALQDQRGPRVLRQDSGFTQCALGMGDPRPTHPLCPHPEHSRIFGTTWREPRAHHAKAWPASGSSSRRARPSSLAFARNARVCRAGPLWAALSSVQGSVQEHHAEAAAERIVDVAAGVEVLDLVAGVRHDELEVQALPERVLNGTERQDLVVRVHFVEVLAWIGIEAKVLVAVVVKAAAEQQGFVTGTEVHEPAKGLHGIAIGQVRIAVLIQDVLVTPREPTAELHVG